MFSRPVFSSAAPLFDYTRALGLNYPNEFGIQAVPASIGHKLPNEIATGKGQIAHHVEDFVADAFVRIAELIADDAVMIRPDEFWFLGRFVDETGKVMWGNASKEPVKMVRRRDPG